jgi:hypothetical protein
MIGAQPEHIVAGADCGVEVLEKLSNRAVEPDQ